MKKYLMILSLVIMIFCIGGCGKNMELSIFVQSLNPQN